MENYQKLVERISSSSGVAVEEIERKVEAKRAKLSGLVSKEGAAQIVAAELGINLDNEKLKIAEIVDGMKRARVVGKVVSVFPVRSYNKNGREGKVANLVIADESSNARVVLWDLHHIDLLEQNKIKVGDVVEVSNANVRNKELHLSSFGDLRLSKEKLGEVVIERVLSAKKLKDVKSGDSIKTRALIVQTFDPRYFEVCPECGKRAYENECKVHGKVTAAKRALLNVMLDDGTETMRCVLFGDHIKKLGLNDEEIFSIEKFLAKKEGLLGEEKVFSGMVKSNQLYNTIEMTIDNVEEVNADELIKELEAKQ